MSSRTARPHSRLYSQTIVQRSNVWLHPSGCFARQSKYRPATIQYVRAREHNHFAQMVYFSFGILRNLNRLGNDRLTVGRGVEGFFQLEERRLDQRGHVAAADLDRDLRGVAV